MKFLFFKTNIKRAYYLNHNESCQEQDWYLMTRTSRILLHKTITYTVTYT